jgi:hypothetical protein
VKKTNWLLFFITVAFLQACEDRKTETVTVELSVNKPLSDRADDPLPEIIKDLIIPIEMGDTLAYLFDIRVKRVDIVPQKQTQIIVPSTWVGENISKPFDFHAYSDIKQDYEEGIPNMKAGTDLAARSMKQIDVSLIDIDAVVAEDSTQMSANAFTSIIKLKEFLIESYKKKPTKNSFKIAFSDLSKVESNAGCVPLLSQFKQYLTKGQWGKSIVSAQELAVNGCNSAMVKAVADSVIRKADEQFGNVKQANSLKMIDIPMGYYACAYPIASTNQKDYIKKKHQACLDFIKTSGSPVLTLPTLPTN